MKNLLFLMSQYPDVDHLVPLADLLSSDYRVSVLTYNEQVPLDDPHFDYLASRNIRVFSASRFYPPNDLSLDWLSRWRSSLAIKAKQGKGIPFLFRTVKKVYDSLLNYWLSLPWGLDVVRFFNPQAIVIDHAFVTPWISNLVQHAKERHIPIVSVPHSSYPFTTTWHGTRGKTITKEEFPWDYVLVENKMRAQMLRELGITNQFEFLGCVRFTQWWIDRSPIEKETYHNIPYLYFGMNPVSTIPDSIGDLQRVLNKYNVPVKIPARRNRKENYAGFDNLIGDEVSSPALINAADCIITTATSVINDAILKHKRILFAKFTIGEETLFSRYGMAKTVNTANELEEIIREGRVPQRPTDIQEYMEDCVWGGYSEIKMLDRYKEFFEWITSEKQ